MRVRLTRFAIFATGVLLTHAVLFAPSLVGLKVLLPLEELAAPNAYLPATPEYADVVALYPALTDQVLQYEFGRRFAAEELRAGRVPLWDPYHYCGAPFVVPFLSPYNLPYYLIPHYLTLAWTQVLAAFVAAGGAYVFFRRVLGLSFWPAVVAAWCYPLTGFFQLWLGSYVRYAASFFPWLLIAVDAVVWRPGGWGGPLLAIATAFSLVSGAADIAGQALLASGLFALWRMGQRFHKDRDRRRLFTTSLVLAGAWLGGMLLAAPYLWPLLEYIPTGLRMQFRASNLREARPPVGLTSLPQMFAPYMFGSTAKNSIWLTPAQCLQESAAQAYCGLVAMLVLAPIGLRNRRLRSLNLFWLLLGILAASWVLNLWPLTALLRLPGLNMVSHNRFLFVLCFAILSLAAVGLDEVVRGGLVWQGSLRGPLACVAVFVGWCVLSHAILYYGYLGSDQSSTPVIQAFVRGVCLLALSVVGILLVAKALPETWRSGFLIPLALLGGLGIWCADRAIEVNSLRMDEYHLRPVQSAEDALPEGRAGLQRYSMQVSLACVAAIALWGIAFRAPPRVAAGVLGVALIGELLWFQHGLNPQCDPRLYYPPLKPLEELAKAPPGRVTGLACLPPMLGQAYGLLDVRGYDAVDPARIARLLLAVRQPQTKVVDYALTQGWVPPLTVDRKTRRFRCVPALNMLNLRYIIGRHRPPEEVSFEPLMIDADDYWVYENPDALPRAYVPKTVQMLAEAQAFKRLTDLTAAFQFDPRAVAYVESDPRLPDMCQGSAQITRETPCEVYVAVDMQTPGLLVLADQWYPGWKAYLDGVPLPVVPANYALRGVRLPAGQGEVVFRYEPASWTRGLYLHTVALCALGLWCAIVAWHGRQEPSGTDTSGSPGSSTRPIEPIG
jgi:hypothetical protein